MYNELIRRVEAAQQTLDHFKTQTFTYGTADCAHVCAYALVKLGHPDPFKGTRHYATEFQAARAMRKAGFTTFEEYLDKRFHRIAPASAIACDILTFVPPENPHITALALHTGSDRVALFNMGTLMFVPYHACPGFNQAWRVPVPELIVA